MSIREFIEELKAVNPEKNIAVKLPMGYGYSGIEFIEECDNDIILHLE